MEIGLCNMNGGPCSTPGGALRIARLAEELGYESLWVGEHVVVPSPRVPPSPLDPTTPILDPLVSLAFLAAATSRVLLATGIIILPQRNPLVLAKQVGQPRRAERGPAAARPRRRLPGARVPGHRRAAGRPRRPVRRVPRGDAAPLGR